MPTDVKTIAVIGGSGAEGSGIALRLAHAGHRIVIGTRDPAKKTKIVAGLNERLRRQAIECLENKQAAAAADIVILTVPYGGQQAMVKELAPLLKDKILIDATAPLVPPKVGLAQLPAGGSAVAAIQAQLGSDVRVISAFQNVSAEKLSELGKQVDCDVLVCGDDEEARRTTIDLIMDMGLRGIDAGPIANSAAAEALTSLLITINRKYKVPGGAGIRITGLSEQLYRSRHPKS